MAAGTAASATARNDRDDPRDGARRPERSDNRRDDDRDAAPGGCRYDPRNDPRNGRNDRDDRNGGYGRDDNRAGPGSLSWSGRVDDIVDITIRGGSVSYQTRSGATVSGVRSRLAGGALPRREGGVTIAAGNGRGSVQVVQQPSQSNGYTAIIRSTTRAAAPGLQLRGALVGTRGLSRTASGHLPVLVCLRRRYRRASAGRRSRLIGVGIPVVVVGGQQAGGDLRCWETR